MSHAISIDERGGGGSMSSKTGTIGDLRGKRVVVMGLGRFGGGVGAARFCASHGADVLVTDSLTADDLRDSLSRLEGLTISNRLGGHDESDFRAADVVVVNPAVDRQSNRYLAAAVGAGARLTSEIELLVERLPNRLRTIGITGTAGKSTTTAMIGRGLSAAFGEKKVRVGGNLGGSLLSEVDSIAADEWVVLELSSFMLEGMTGWSPHIAVVTNLSGNHLDRHRTLEAYEAAKRRVLRWQHAGDTAVLGAGVADWAAESKGRAVVIDRGLTGEMAIPGEHNRLNAAMAAAVCEAAGADRAKADAAIRSFAGLPHRMELIGQFGGVRFYNDSKSTTPEAAMLALHCFERGRVHLILGGYDKGSDMTGLGREAATWAAGVYTIGATGNGIAATVEAAGGTATVDRCGRLDEAVRRATDAARRAGPGGVVVLSPGCASWDQYENYEQRGRDFRESVLRWAGRS